MNAIRMQTLPNLLRLLHEARNVWLTNHDVRTRNGLLLIETPYVQLMHTARTKYRLQIALHVVDLDARWRRLNQNQTAAFRQGYRSDQDHDGDPHADCWVGVEPLLRLDEPRTCVNGVSICLACSTYMDILTR